MKALLLINDTPVNRISYYHVLLLMASLPFDMFYSHIILISLIIHTLIHIRKERWQLLKSSKLLILPSVLFISIIATPYSINRAGAFNEWGLRVPMLLFPIVFILTEFDLHKYRQQLLTFFSLICTAAIVVLYLIVLVTIRYYHLPIRAIFAEGFTNHNFSAPIKIHATFFSFQLLIATVNLLYLLIKGGLSRRAKLVYAISSIILMAGIVQLSSKSILIILFLAVILLLPYYLLAGKQRVKFILSGLFIALVCLIAILSISTFRERYITLLKDDIVANKNIPRNSDSRIERWHVAIARIKDKPFIGYGSGSEVDLLHNDFYNAKLYSSFLYHLNSHNQYLSFLLKSGIWGLAIYLLTLIYGIRLSLQFKDVLFITFMMVITLVSVTENFLDVDKGVMFYSFFFSFFIFSNTANRSGFKGDINTDVYLDTGATQAKTVTSY